MKSITQQFEAWVRTKPADERYNYWSTQDGPCGCAAIQFINSKGLSSDDDGEGADIFNDMHTGAVASALVREPYTFGALADRLAKVSA